VPDPKEEIHLEEDYVYKKDFTKRINKPLILRVRSAGKIKGKKNGDHFVLSCCSFKKIHLQNRTKSEGKPGVISANFIVEQRTETLA